SEEQTAYPPKYKNQFAKMIVSLSGKSESVSLPQNHLEDLVRAALAGTHRFDLLERTSAVPDLAAEHALAGRGRVDSTTAARPGRMVGAEFLAKATLIELNPEKEVKEIKAAGGKAGSGAPLLGDIGLKDKVAFCRVNLRVIRTETGEIAFDEMIDGVISKL